MGHNDVRNDDNARSQVALPIRGVTRKERKLSMLVKATAEDIEKYGDWVYSLALDQSKSAYPTYTDSIKTKEDFLCDARKGVSRDSYEILLFFHEGNMEGWIEYFWIAEENYLQLSGCNINVATESALMELLSLLENRFSGYSLYFGFPKANVNAIEFLEQNGFTCIEDDYNNSFFFDTYEPRSVCENVVEVGEENFKDFRTVHAQVEGEMYWTCDRILAEMDSWKVYVYYENEKPEGAIYFTGGSEYLEIYGVDFLEGKFAKEKFQALLIAALNEGKRMGAKYLTFFCEEKEQAALEGLDFRYVGQYVCYMKEV